VAPFFGPPCSGHRLTASKAGFQLSIQRNARKKVRKERKKEKYATNVADEVDGMAVQIIIHFPQPPPFATRSSAFAI